jgi:hypothetical protein
VGALSAGVSTTTDAELSRWIRAHNVCFEVSPHFEILHHTKRQSACDLTLYALHPDRSVADPGGPENAKIWERLEEIALRVLPREAHYDIDPFDAAYHLRPETRFEPEVDLTVRIWPDQGGFAPVDEEVRHQVHAMEEALLRLGAQSKLWHQGRRR